MPVTHVRRNGAETEAQRNERRVTAREAGEASLLFPKGGEAFASWCASSGIDPLVKRLSSEWDSFLYAFSRRPIHGHRRGEAGGTHKPNAAQLQ